MIFKTLTVENFGLFKGKYVFDLSLASSLERDKPIILLGGKNGSGKTTFFEAVRLCLYGQSMFKNKLIRSDYEAYLGQKIHHSAENLPASSASVEVEFEYSHLGKRELYAVKREWRVEDNQVHEQLTVHKDGYLLKELETDQWQDFLKDMIPLGLSRLFFFDGEKIQNLADDVGHNEELKDSVKSLLGLDLVEKLQVDLEIYKGRQIKNNGNGDLLNALEGLEEEKKVLNDKFETFQQEKAQTQVKLDRALEEIERQEQLISREGGSFANKREELKALRIRLDTEIAEYEDKIREISADLLPFAFVPKLCLKLREQLLKEEEYARWKISQNAINVRLKKLVENANSTRLWQNLNLDTSTKRTILKNLIGELANSPLSDASYGNFKPIHNLSVAEQKKIIAAIEEVNSQTAKQVISFTRKLENATRQRQEVERKLSSAPSEDVINPLIQKANELHQQLGQLQFLLKQQNEELHHLRFKLDETERKIQKYTDISMEREDLVARLNLILGAQQVLQEYLTTLKEEKIRELGTLFLKYFNEISRKNNLIVKIEIDPEDFSVLLYKSNGKVIPRSELSAGEKQIYSIAMLWALTKASGRSLPFIIDTPLARLDSEHRSKIVKNFFPKASEQVIILSTDTEVDKQHFETLRKNISHVYHLDYDHKNMMTQVTTGYFWER